MRDRKESVISSQRAASRVTVKVLTGSEKEKFLTDSELAKVLESEGIRVLDTSLKDVAKGAFDGDTADQRKIPRK